jgi:hypothetical protein
MTMNEGELREALRELAATAPQQAPPVIEQNLREAFRARQTTRVRVRGVVAGLAAAAVAAGLALIFRIPAQSPRPEAHIVVPPPPAIAAPAPVQEALAPRKVVRRHASVRRPQAESLPATEVATKFYALPDADIFAPVEDVTVIRVQLPRSAMRMVGLPVNEERATERIRADVLLGQDGIARAVRFVQ